MDDLRTEAEKLANEHPDQAGEIQGRLAEIQEVWEELNDTMKRREESLGEASKLQGFLRDLDDFQSWLSRTQTAVASEDIPTSLPEAESLLAQHESIKNEVDNYKEDYEKMRAVGEEVTQGQTDAQHMFLAQRLQALDTGWHELRCMWENRHSLLAQAFDFQTFLRDAKQAEAFLNSQVRKILELKPVPERYGLFETKIMYQCTTLLAEFTVQQSVPNSEPHNCVYLKYYIILYNLSR